VDESITARRPGWGLMVDVESRELRIVWTPGFILLTQAMTGLIGLALLPLAPRAPGGPPRLAVEALDIALSAAMLAGILWRPLRGTPPYWLAIPALIPWSIPCLHGAVPCSLALLIGGSSRLYFSLSALAMILDYSEGVMLGANTTLAQLAIVAVLVVSSGALMVYAVESGAPGSHIHTLGDAFWWALATATTVGYGDVVPVTTAGRIIASLLMLFGIGSFGIFISDMAARIVRVSLLGVERGPVLNREKVRILRQLTRLEDLTDDELEIIIARLRLIHAISRGAMSEDILSKLDGPEATV
jgi:hypothetical protein